MSLSNEERHRLLVDFNPPGEPLPEVCVHTLFERQAQRTPDAVAVTFGETQLTYAELDAAANRVANVLRELGIGPESTVAVCLQPSHEVIVSLLGVLKAGGAYVPVDPDAPRDRLEAMIRRAAAGVILAHGRTAGVVASLEAKIVDVGAIEPGPSSPVDSGVKPHNLAYVLFTSGSTGEPKGVLVPHSAVVNHNLAVAKAFGLSAADRVLQFTPVFFDAAGEEIYPPLLSGSTVVVRGELVPLGEFGGLIESERLSVLSLPPAYLHEWISEVARQGGTLPSCLRLVLLGGEKLLPETRKLWDSVGGAHVPWINVYGPTEATVTSAMCWITSEDPLDRPVLPIGRPITNARIYLLDENLELVPPGQEGELFISGAGVARGYLGQPELTAERFLADPYSDVPGARMYRTGDLARHLPDGKLEFVGRVDHQVKIRGYRIEPGEIEALLRSEAQVQEALVLAREDTPGVKRLVAYVVQEPPTTDDAYRERARALQQLVAAKLPEYMVPSAFVVLRALPLTANGKVDRKALPVPDDRSVPSTVEFVGARDETEAALVKIWREALGVERIGVFDNFFELGGHSLAAMQIVTQISEQLGQGLDLVQVFDTPTIAELAASLKRSAALAPSPEVDVDQLSDEQVEQMLLELAQKG